MTAREASDGAPLLDRAVDRALDRAAERAGDAARPGPPPGSMAAGADVAHLLAVDWTRLTPGERRTIERVLRRETVAENAVAAFEDRRPVGDRLADRVAAFGGSWTFILAFTAFLAAWALLNTELLGPRHDAFDPYPYVFLNLILSMVAALQAPVIMMSQNRQAQRDRYDAAADYAVNLKAELEIRRLHERLDALQGLLERTCGEPAERGARAGARDAGER